MKKLIILIAVLMSALTVYGQGYPPRPPVPPQGPAHQQRPVSKQGPVSQPGPVSKHGPKQGMGMQHGGPQHHQGPHDMHRRDVYCTQDWQELWNGRHVRLQGGKVRICKRDGDILLRGDEVILVPSGSYLVRNGSDWRVYDEDGDRTSIHGDEILAWHDGFYCARQSGTWRVYDSDGDRLFGLWSNQYIEQLWNGCFLYQRDSRFYVADRHGDRIFNVWGDDITLMDNGLFRCRKNGHYYYYDIDGNEKR